MEKGERFRQIHIDNTPLFDIRQRCSRDMTVKFRQTRGKMRLRANEGKGVPARRRSPPSARPAKKRVPGMSARGANIMGAWGWERMRKGFQVALSIAISALLVGAALLALLTLLRGALSSEALRRALEALAAFSGAR